MLKNSNKTIIILSIIGFIITGILAYPWAPNWDSAYVVSHMIDDGTPWMTDWMGWYYPGLIHILSKLTGVVLAIGTYQNLLYWIGITLISIALYGNKRHAVLWYALTAWFPGALAFMMFLTNNTLLFAYIVLGVGLYSFYYCGRTRGKWLLILSYLLLLQAVFIRREAIIYIPLLVLMLSYFLFRKNNSRKSSVIKSAAIAFLPFLAILPIEKELTKEIPEYHHINSIDYTAMFDMEGMSYYKGEIVFPVSVFKPQYRSHDFLMEKVNRDADVITKDVNEFWQDTTLLVSEKASLIEIENPVAIYMRNIIPYVKFRGRIVMDYLKICWFGYHNFENDTDTQLTSYPNKHSSELSTFLSKKPMKILLWSGIPVIMGLIMLILCSIRRIPFETPSDRKRYILFLYFAFAIMLLYMLSSVYVQLRYIYPVCLAMWYLNIYGISRMSSRCGTEK